MLTVLDPNGNTSVLVISNCYLCSLTSLLCVFVMSYIHPYFVVSLFYTYIA